MFTCLQHKLACNDDQPLAGRGISGVIAEGKLEEITRVVIRRRNQIAIFETCIALCNDVVDALYAQCCFQFVFNDINFGSVRDDQSLGRSDLCLRVFKSRLTNRSSRVDHEVSQLHLSHLCVQEWQARVVRVGQGNTLQSCSCIVDTAFQHC